MNQRLLRCQMVGAWEEVKGHDTAIDSNRQVNQSDKNQRHSIEGAKVNI